MNRSFRAQESVLLDSAERQRQQLRASMMAEKDEELSLFLEMRRREKEQDNLLLNNSDEFETPLGKIRLMFLSYLWRRHWRTHVSLIW